MGKGSEGISELFKSSEELEGVEVGVVQGQIPSWLNGTLIRNGPAKFDVGGDSSSKPPFTVNHWLDGYALLSKFEIANGQVKYSKKFLRSEAYEKAVNYGKPILTEFGTKGAPDPSKSYFSRLMNSMIPMEMSDNDCASISQIGPDLFANSDTCFIRRITTALDTCERYDTNKVFGLNGICAHPIRESDGTVYQVGFSAITGLKFNVLKIPGKLYASSESALKNAEIIATIPSRWTTGLAYNHSFGVSEKYIVLIEQPYIVSMSKMAGSVMKRGAAFKDWLEWRGGVETNRFVLVEKDTGRVHRIEYFSKESFFFLHFVNCYEEAEELVVELIAYKTPKLLETMFLKDLRSSVLGEADPPMATRFRLPLSLNDKKTKTVTITGEPFTSAGLEMPAVNRHFVGKKTQFCYVTGTVNDSDFKNSLCKIDCESGQVHSWRPSETTFPGEPVFVPRGTDGAEDDGVVLSAVTDIGSNRDDFLVVIDAKSWAEIAKVSFKAHVPQALHGLFIDSNNNL